MHVHLHWLASRPTLISFFSPDQFATPATANIFEHASLLVFSSPIFSETQRIIPLVNTGPPSFFVIPIIRYLSDRETLAPRSIQLLIPVIRYRWKRKRKERKIYKKFCSINKGRKRGYGRWKVVWFICYDFC